MKINEVEQRVGITKGNIRFYEREGLLNPDRNSENGYRDYSEEDVTSLKKIKLLRKLALPMEEIRKLECGILTVEDAIRRHLITLAREEKNLKTMGILCQQIAQTGETLERLDADRYLNEMSQMEGAGTRFVNIKKNDTRAKYIQPILAAAVFIAFMLSMIALLVWALVAYPADAPPIGFVVFIAIIPVVLIGGVLLALFQRFKQIKGGEEDAAAQY